MPRLLFITILLSITLTDLSAQKIRKGEMFFKGIENKRNSWMLCFEDRNKKENCFNIQRSNTEPYIFYSSAADGSFKENEKIKGNWFLISYTTLQTDKSTYKFIVKVKSIAGSK